MARKQQPNPIDNAVVKGARAINNSRFVVITVALLAIFGGCTAYREVQKASMSADCDIARTRARTLEMLMDIERAGMDSETAKYSALKQERAALGKTLSECAKWGI